MGQFLKKDKQKGFTLVEIIVVLIIIAILAAIAIPTYIQYIEKTKIAVLEQNQSQVLRTLQLLVIEGELGNTNIQVREAINETGFFVTNPLNKKTTIITSSQVAGSEGSGIIISQRVSPKWDTQINNPPTYLYPVNSTSTNSQGKSDGSVIIQVVSEGALVYYYYDGKANNITKVAINY